MSAAEVLHMFHGNWNSFFGESSKYIAINGTSCAHNSHIAQEARDVLEYVWLIDKEELLKATKSNEMLFTSSKTNAEKLHII